MLSLRPPGFGGGSCRNTPQRYLCLLCWKPQFSRLSGDLFDETATSERLGRKTRGGEELRA
jgi:hypothetical protein